MNIAYTIRWVHSTEEQEPSLCLFKSMSSLCQVTGYAALKKLSLAASAIVKSKVYMVITISMYIEFGSNHLTEAPDTWHSTINDAMLTVALQCRSRSRDSDSITLDFGLWTRFDGLRLRVSDSIRQAQASSFGLDCMRAAVLNCAG